ncbi:MAG: phosphoglucosamine mutase [Firmicutes bacterium]|nr:phosphoglucosamine mutase [Bacillota bacterium]
MGKLFGTDGIRGIVGEDLTCELAMKVGVASAYVLGKDTEVTVLVGRDTRISGQMLAAALSSGLMSHGAKVIDLGIVPTPAVSYLVKKYGATMGAMISASHNPSEYNGIKLFDSEGFKLPDATENEIEKYLLGKSVPSSNKVGTYEICNTAIKDYTDYIVDTSKEIDHDINVVVDCAYGSASATAKELFNKLNVNATFINYDYDGYNINQNAGSTHLEGLIQKVKDLGAHAGIAYDGDADRCLMVDENGELVDGDQIMAISALALKKENKLKGNTLVGTVMSNLGLVKFCESQDINFEKTKVGDRYVLEKMLESNYVIGGEQSGHVIFKDYANTGDGQLTSVQILNILTKESKKLSELASMMKRYPQVLINVKVREEGKMQYENDSAITNLITKVEKELANDGRVLIRPSGTEGLIRVMIEGLDQDDITNKAQAIADLIKEKFGI